MTKASDNDYPSVLLTEQGSAPTTPAASHQRMYIRTSDHTLVTVNSSGTVTAVASGGSAATVAAHGCRVTRSGSSFSIGNATYTAVQFNAEDFDTDTMHDTVTNNDRVTIPSISGVTTGLWSIVGSGYIDSQTRVQSTIEVDGTTLIAFQDQNGTLGSFLIETTYVLSAAQYVRLKLQSPAGAANAVFDAGISPILSVSFLGKVS